MLQDVRRALPGGQGRGRGGRQGGERGRGKEIRCTRASRSGAHHTVRLPCYIARAASFQPKPHVSVSTRLTGTGPSDILAWTDSGGRGEGTRMHRSHFDEVET